MADGGDPNVDSSCLEVEVNFCGRQIIGGRMTQEDSYGVIPPSELSPEGKDILAVVADGMGGHAAGEVASQVAVCSFAEHFLSSSHEIDAARLWDALEGANTRIKDAIATSDGKLQGMGTTLVGVLLRGLSLRWISVGDSPLYLFRASELQQLNATHSYAEDLERQVDEGIISKQEALNNSERNVLKAALIGELIYEVDDSESFQLMPNDIILVMTDGVNSLPENSLNRIMDFCRELTASSIAEKILDAVKDVARPRQDNATVVAIKVPDFDIS